MYHLKRSMLRKTIVGVGVILTSMSFIMTVSAKSCSYAYDSQAIGYGNINIQSAAINPYTYSAYVIGSNAAMANGIAYYSVGAGSGQFTNVQAKTKMTVGTVAPGTTKTTTKSVVGIRLYKSSVQVASITDTV